MPNTPRSGDSDRNQNGMNITTLYIEPLGGELKHEDILNYFSAFGDVKTMQIRNKRKRSYGFVKFISSESASKALEVKLPKIAGRGVRIAVAKDRHQDKTTLLDLNDDCILEILSTKCLSIIDLCSVAETCPRLKKIAARAFRIAHKICDINSLSDNKPKPAERILTNFGSVMSDLRFDDAHYTENWSTVLNYATKYCSNMLVGLHLKNLYVRRNLTVKLGSIFKNLHKLSIHDCYFEGASKELFADCESLVELDLQESDVAYENTFSKLQQFTCGDVDDSDLLESFISRHKNLKLLKICNYVELSELSSIADCKRLETLECRLSKKYTLDLTNFSYLKTLSIDCAKRTVAKTALGLNNSILLEHLKIINAEIDSGFIRSLTQIKRLQALELYRCTGLQNLCRIGNLHHVTTLRVTSSENFHLDIVLLVKRLSKLSYLRVEVNEFKFDLKKYLRIVDVVRRRTDKAKLNFFLESYHLNDSDDNMQQHFTRNAHLVEMIECDSNSESADNEYYSSDSDYSEYDSDGSF